VIARALLGHEPLTTLAAAAGLWVGIRRGLARELAPVLAFPAVDLAVFGLYDFAYPRYAMPLVPFLAVLAGVFLGGYAHLALRVAAGLPATAAILGTVLALPVISSLRLDVLLSRPDSRELAAAHVLEMLPRDARVALGRGAPEITPSRESLQWQDARLGTAELRGIEWEPLGARERRLLGLPADRYPKDARFVVPLWKFVDPSRADAPSLDRLLEESGVAWALLRVPARGVDEEAILRAVETRGTLVERFDPTPSGLGSGLGERRGGGRGTDDDRSGRAAAWFGLVPETSLPTDMTCPLAALLGIERPGPELRLYRLAPLRLESR
jgi:hypothetical protein